MKPTTAQLALLHVAESAAASLLLTLLVGIFQQLATGKISANELLTVLGSGFVAALGLIYKTVKADPNLTQAEADTSGQFQQFVETRFSTFEARLAQWFARQPVAAQLTSPQMPTAIRTSTPASAQQQQPSQPLPQQAYASPASSFSSGMVAPQASLANAPVNWQQVYQPQPQRPSGG